VSRRTEIQVGVTVIVAVAVMLWGVTWLREFSVGRKVHVWHVRFPETGGLGASDEVLVNGIRKGSVAHIDLQGDHVIVDLALATDVRLTTDCRVAIRNVGLMGQKVIAVDMHPSGAPIAERDTVQGIYELGMGEVMADVGLTMQSVDKTVAALDAITKRLDRNGDVDRTVGNLRKASDELATAVEEDRALLHETLANAEAASRTAKELTSGRENELRHTLDSADRTAQNLERLTVRMDSLMTVVRSVSDKLDHGNGNAAVLLNDRKLYDEITTTLTSMKALLEDLRKNPKRYINVHVL